MPEMLDDVQSLESTTVGIYRTAATVKGGRRFSYSALVVVGDRHGRVGMGYGKANQVPPAIEKAQKEGKKSLREFPMEGRTLPHEVTGRFGACLVRLIPASPGTGVIAGAAVRAVLEMMGVQDCLTKSFGSTNPKNLIKAALDGLSQLRSKDRIMELRGVELDATEVEEAIERGRAYMPQSSGGAKAKAPENKVGQRERGGGGRGRGKGRRGGGGGPGRAQRGERGQDTSAPEGGDRQETPSKSGAEATAASPDATKQEALNTRENADAGSTPTPTPEPTQQEGQQSGNPDAGGADKEA